MTGRSARRRPSPVAPAALAAAAAACTLTTSLDGLTGGDGGADGAGEGGGACRRDLATDPASCGRCGHSCLGGACRDGRCLPHPLATGRGEPRGLAVAATHVYWAEALPPRILRMDRGGGPPEALETDALSDPFDVAVDAAHLHWSERSGNAVWRRPLGGGAAEMYFPGAGAAAYLALHEGQVFVTDLRAAGSVIVGPTATGSSLLLYPQQPWAAGVAVAAGRLYWGRGDPPAIAGGPRAGGTAVTVAASDGAVAGVAADEAALYWVSDRRWIVRAPLAGGAPIVLHDAGAAAIGDGDVAVDAEAVYWTEPAAGRLVKLAK